MPRCDLENVTFLEMYMHCFVFCPIEKTVFFM